MATKTTTATAPDRLSDALAMLEAGIMNLTSSDEWRRWLEFQAAFHVYSFSNVQLIMGQRPDATRVASFKAWQKLGRNVVKGEKAIWILAPMLFKRKDAEDNADDKDGTEKDERQQTRMSFKPVPVFAIEQTDGEDLPSPVRKLEGDDDGGIFTRLKVWAEAWGCPVTIEDFPGRANGFYSPEAHAITVRASMSPVQQLKTLAHELAHAHLHRDIAVYREHRADSELEAESTAYVVLSHFGIDSGDYSFGYVSSWQGGGPEAIKSLKACAGRIQATAKAIIAGMALNGSEAPVEELIV